MTTTATVAQAVLYTILAATFTAAQETFLALVAAWFAGAWTCAAVVTVQDRWKESQ